MILTIYLGNSRIKNNNSKSYGGNIMEYRKFDNIIIARIDKGEEILEQLKAIAITENIKLASINALGAINDFTVGVYKTDERILLQTASRGIMKLHH